MAFGALSFVGANYPGGVAQWARDKMSGLNATKLNTAPQGALPAAGAQPPPPVPTDPAAAPAVGPAAGPPAINPVLARLASITKPTTGPSPNIEAVMRLMNSNRLAKR